MEGVSPAYRRGMELYGWKAPRNTRRDCHRYPSEWWGKRRNNASKRGLSWELTPADYPVMPKVCPVLGIPLDSRDRNHTPSLDRLNNSKGYVPGNVAIISFRANTLKSDGTAEEHRLIADWMSRDGSEA